MSDFTPEMADWLKANRNDYEFYLLHNILHDPIRRNLMMAVPLLPEDFSTDEYSLIIASLTEGVKVLNQIGLAVESPPSMELFRTFMVAVADKSDYESDIVDTAMVEVRKLMVREPYDAVWESTVNPYFSAWLNTVRGKLLARKVQAAAVVDMRMINQSIESNLAAAARATESDHDEMDDVLDGEHTERIVRAPTGISGLDVCLNGGWGPHECYLMISGTGGGKSLATGQCAWHEAVCGGYPCVVTTELRARDFIMRTVSNALNVPINRVQDCQNLWELKVTFEADVKLRSKLSDLERVLRVVRQRMRFHKVTVDAGMDTFTLLNREMDRFVSKMGCPPTWMAFDWLGSVADQTSHKNSGDRAAAWEYSANGCVKFADVTGIPTLVLAQTVNDAQTKSILTIQDIGIGKGIAKGMTAAIGITNAVDRAGVEAARRGQGEMPTNMTLEDQLFCVMKARKGEGHNIPVRRDFIHQRFIERPRGER